MNYDLSQLEETMRKLKKKDSILFQALQKKIKQNASKEDMPKLGKLIENQRELVIQKIVDKKMTDSFEQWGFAKKIEEETIIFEKA